MVSTAYNLRTILERVLIPDLVLNGNDRFSDDPARSISGLFSENVCPGMSGLAEMMEGFIIRKYSFHDKYTIIELDLPALKTDGQGSCERIYAVSKDGHSFVYLIEKNTQWSYCTDRFIASIDQVRRGEFCDCVIHTVYEASEEEKQDELTFITETIERKYKVRYKTENITYNKRS